MGIKRRQRTGRKKYVQIVRILGKVKGDENMKKHKDGIMIPDRTEILEICPDFSQEPFNSTKPKENKKEN